MDNFLPQEMQLPRPELRGVGDVNSIPGEPQSGMEEEFVGEDKKELLRQMIEEIKGKLGEANSLGFVTDNMGKVQKGEALQKVFELLQQSGVDLTNPESVRQFIEKMRSSNPEIAQLFEEVMNELLSDDEGMEEGMEMPEEEEEYSEEQVPMY